MSYRRISRYGLIISILLLVVVITPIGCGGGGGGSTGISSTGVVTVGTGAAGKNIVLDTGVQKQIIKTLNFTVGNFGGPYEALTVDLSAHIPWITVTPAVPKAAPASNTAAKLLTTPSATMHIRISREEDIDTVCSMGELYGPFNIFTDDTDSQVGDVQPASLSASQPTIDIINSGSLVICMIVTPVIDATVDLDSVSFDLDACTTPPEDISGSWQGTYFCSGVCPESGNVSLTITQSPTDMSHASYVDDSGAMYEGTVCGNRFSYTGGEAGSYNESGTFILESALSASKTSTYKDIAGFCSGTCTDVLTKN
ncbi:MAG: hypothetical protein KZQ73_12570 [Candidatus Thiodiazotropha sp. (ex Semelilucina semeliformis)]|nr:hypothetical protein [Candidatus Thiodiazotropha sp. (ex Semelilucina semeliformis)]